MTDVGIEQPQNKLLIGGVGSITIDKSDYASANINYDEIADKNVVFTLSFSDTTPALPVTHNRVQFRRDLSM